MDTAVLLHPDSELRSRARLTAERAVVRGLGQPGAGLPGIHVVTERGPAPRVLLLVVGMRHRWLLQGGPCTA